MENLLTNNDEGSFWQPDVANREFKPLSPTQLRTLGLSSHSAKFVNTIDELRNDPPNIIIAQSLRNFSFIQNWFKQQSLKKGVHYVMGLGVYQQMHAGYDKRTGAKQKILKPSNLKFKNNYRPYIGQDLTDKTLLVFRTGGIGDLLFIQPNLRYLKEQYPTCTINFACGPQYQSMVENWDCVDNVVDLPYSFKWLKEADYHALFEGVIERCKEAHSTNAYHLFTRWLGLNLPDNLLLPQQDPKEDKLDECVEILNNWGVKRFVLTQLRASSPIRTPRPEFWKSLIDKITDFGYPVLITDNPRQAKNVDRFIQMVKNKHMVFNFCQHSKSLDYTIALTSLANCVVATDSAMNHIAASMNTPCYGIYGPFPGRIRLTTYPLAKWVDPERHCVPCFLHGHKPCPQAGKDGFSPCYDVIDLDKVVSEIGVMING